MLRVQSITKSHGPDLILQDVSFILNTAERAGLVGANGSGKSTLLQILAGNLLPDAGSVWTSPSIEVAYLPQYPLGELDLSVRQVLEVGAGRAGDARHRLSELESAMETERGEALELAITEYGQTRETLERLGGYSLEARMQQVIAGLSIDVRDLEMPVRMLSGGNKTKLSLARILLSGAGILLLDEPTNYLDLPALIWLEQFITSGHRSYLIVSHDRRFLDRTVNTILTLDSTSGLRRWAGNYTAYATARQREEEKELAAYLDQQEEIRRVEGNIRHTKDQARGVEAHTRSGPGADVKRRLAKKVARKAKVRERRLERQLESARLDKPTQSWGLHLADLGHRPIEDDRIILDIGSLLCRLRGEDYSPRCRSRRPRPRPRRTSGSEWIG